jgi:hypothetical protein
MCFWDGPWLIIEVGLLRGPSLKIEERSTSINRFWKIDKLLLSP